MATAAAERGGVAGNLKDFSSRIRSFYIEVRGEMKKVTRPGWKEVRSTTIVVLVTVAIFGIFFYVVDAIFSRVVDVFFTRMSH